ncbi:hypothetical protein BGZ99_008118 [Dissophora globulifera]|uniref:Glutathione S-transferase n=1 Tax=Dissophora globulifera TaxID=979702 RepID=A0A9P6RA22_9FUNG|nr:hypothetical protein BGZ99_008118 [Dissophora globulifera]
MTKLTLYTSRTCPFANRAVVALAETQQEYEAVDIDLRTPRPDWYLKDINPYGQVPALKVDDKDVIIESLFVAEYISDLHPEAGLFPTDPLQRAQTRYLVHHWGSHVSPLVHKSMITLDPVESAKFRESLVVELEKIDKLLRNASRAEGETGAYFLGDKFTFADLAVGPFLYRFFLATSFQEKSVAEEFEASLYANKNLKRFLEWRDHVRQRPSIRNASLPQETLEGLYRKYVIKTEN